MKTTTLLEVMAEVGALTRELDSRIVDVEDAIDSVDEHVEDAANGAGDDRRRALKMAAAMAIIALRAHDAEAAKAGS